MPRSLAFKIIKRLTSRKFPIVEWITTKELAGWLEDPLKPQPIILDARTEAEYAVSHLRNAQRIDPYHSNLVVSAESKDTPIAVYCSVGYRSA
jgi:rhodanese-related sulfurtransferase